MQMPVSIGQHSLGSAIAIGDYLVSFGRDVGDPLTNLKLQKLLYYAQGWFLAKHARPLFGEPLQAWIRGPVVYEVWSKFRTCRWEPINSRKIKKPDLPPAAVDHLAQVVEDYWDFSAYTLENMTHREAPWLNARRGSAKDTPSSAPISLEDMYAHFSQLLNGRKKAISKATGSRKMA
jgi:uncharacterized phage-associated protein